MLKPKLSYSFGKSLLTKPFELIKYELNKPFVPSPVMDRGSRFEYVLQYGMRDLVLYTETATRGVKFNNFARDTAIVNELYMDHPYLICTQAEYDAAQVFCDSISYRVQSIVTGSTFQDHFEFEEDDVISHGYTDFLSDYCIYDLKISDPAPEAFSKQVVNFKWHLQAYMYTKALERPFCWIVIGPEAPHVCRIYECNDRFLKSGERLFNEAKVLFKEFNLDQPQEIARELHAPAWLK